jgi:hypothetical protein
VATDAMSGAQDRISIYGPRSDGTYVIEFRAADGQFLAISVPASEAKVLQYLQSRMPNGIAVPD